MPAPTALVRRPSPRLADGLLTHVQRSPVDVGLAVRQWQAYVDAVRGAGWRVVEVPPAAGCPDSAVVEDTVVVLGDLAVITRAGAGQRRAEVAGTEKAVRAEGLEVVRVMAPGTLDAATSSRWAPPRTGVDHVHQAWPRFAWRIHRAKRGGAC